VYSVILYTARVSIENPLKTTQLCVW